MYCSGLVGVGVVSFSGLLFANLGYAQSPAQNLAQKPPLATIACSASQLSFVVERAAEKSAGGSYTRANLVLHNRSSQACHVFGRPVIRFEDAARRALRISPMPKFGMHPGPVIVPVTIPPKGTVTSQVRWLSGGDVTDQGSCLSPAYLALRLNYDDVLRQAFTSQLCGSKGAAPSYSLTLFQRQLPQTLPFK